MRLEFSTRRRDRVSTSRKDCVLRVAGWNQVAKRWLERLIAKGAGRRLPVVFDFDNTIISGDVGEAALAVLAAQRRLTPASVSKSLCPGLRGIGKKVVELANCSDVMQYYEALLAPTAHGVADPHPMANGYVWATEALEGLTLTEITKATADAFEAGKQSSEARIEVTPGKTGYPAPRFYPQMVELIGQLVRFEYDVWIVSASNVWSVRWLVLQGLNPLLRKRGLSKGLRADHVIGVATMLRGPDGRLYKDSVLVRQNPGYAAFKPQVAGSMRVTRYLEFPVPVYSGKAACILDAIGRNPYLCVGDSPADHPMMRVSQHRLWIARVEKPQAQHATRALIRQAGKAGWMMQISTTANGPRFLSRIESRADSPNKRAWKETAAILRSLEKEISRLAKPIALIPLNQHD
jgi:phosphoserine phosphatase